MTERGVDFCGLAWRVTRFYFSCILFYDCITRREGQGGKSRVPKLKTRLPGTLNQFTMYSVLRTLYI